MQEPAFAFDDGLFCAALERGSERRAGPCSDLGPRPGPGPRHRHIQTAAFILVEHANGTATLTINPSELLDAAALQNDLRQDGIPALVTSGSFCSSDPAPAGFSQVVSFYPPPAAVWVLAAAKGRASHHHVQPGCHATGHRTQLRRLPAHVAAGGQLRTRQYQLLYLYQRPAVRGPGPARRGVPSRSLRPGRIVTSLGRSLGTAGGAGWHPQPYHQLGNLSDLSVYEARPAR
jgi:hypothetical protein